MSLGREPYRSSEVELLNTKSVWIRVCVFLLGVFLIHASSAHADEMDTILKNVTNFTEKQEKILHQTLQDVSDETKPAVWYVILLAQHGRNQTEEAIRLARAKNHLKKSVLHLNFADRRVRDMKSVANRVPREFVEVIVSDYKTHLNKALGQLDEAAYEGADVAFALRRLRNNARENSDAIRKTHKQAPDRVRDELKKAFEVTKRGLSTAIERLNQVEGSNSSSQESTKS